MSSCVQKIVQIFMIFLENYKEDVPINKQLHFQKLIDAIEKISQDNLWLKTLKKRQSGIGVKNIFQIPEIRLRFSLYYMPKGQTMQLHNHPQMCVITYILQGKMEAKLYTPLQQDIFSRKIIEYSKGDILTIDGQISNENNLHELTAIQNTTFLDILFPDYDDQNDGLYFAEQYKISENSYKLKIVEEQQDESYQL